MSTVRALFWHKYLSIKVFGSDPLTGQKRDITGVIEKLGYLALEVDYDPSMLNLVAPPIVQPPVQPPTQPMPLFVPGMWYGADPTTTAPTSPKVSVSSDFARGAKAMQDAIMNEKQNALARGHLNLEDFRISSIDIPKDGG